MIDTTKILFVGYPTHGGIARDWRELERIRGSFDVEELERTFLAEHTDLVLAIIPRAQHASLMGLWLLDGAKAPGVAWLACIDGPHPYRVHIRTRDGGLLEKEVRVYERAAVRPKLTLIRGGA